MSAHHIRSISSRPAGVPPCLVAARTAAHPGGRGAAAQHPPLPGDLLPPAPGCLRQQPDFQVLETAICRPFHQRTFGRTAGDTRSACPAPSPTGLRWGKLPGSSRYSDCPYAHYRMLNPVQRSRQICAHLRRAPDHPFPQAAQTAAAQRHPRLMRSTPPAWLQAPEMHERSVDLESQSASDNDLVAY